MTWLPKGQDEASLVAYLHSIELAYNNHKTLEQAYFDFLIKEMDN